MMHIGITNRNVSISRPGQNGAARPSRAPMPRPEPASGAPATPSRISVVMSVSLSWDELPGPDLVPRVDHGLGREAGALEVHGVDRLRLVVQVPVGPVLLALVDEDLVRGFVEQRPAVQHEVG